MPCRGKDELMLYLSHRENKVKVLGPGNRYVIWVQGCKKRCKGCIFPEGQPLNKNGYWIDAKELMDEINSTKNLTGVTISGGEPFLQSRGIAEFLKLIKDETSLDVMIYSGYTLAELKCWNNVDVNYIIDNSDILIDGEYVEELNNNSIYRGSDNQVVHFLSNKYKPFAQIINNTKNRSLEFIYKNNALFTVGLPEKGFQSKFWQQVEKEYNKEK